MKKLFLIWFYKRRLKYHYLSRRSAAEDADCGHVIFLTISPQYAYHHAKVDEYILKLRGLGEPI